MSQFYFDSETTGFDPEKDKIITIQYQQLDMDGRVLGELVILKEWEIGEEAILKNIHSKLFDVNSWYFIPIGTNLIFDFTFLWGRFKKFNMPCPDLSKYLYDKPLIDIKHTLVIANGLSFKGAGLDQMTDKKSNGKEIPKWYRLQDFERIEEYIKQETESFIKVLLKLVNELPKVIK